MTDLSTDASALAARIDAHQRFSTRDVTQWILGLVEPQAGERVLDVGCGTGHQALQAAVRVAPGAVVGVDASAAALAEARSAAGRAGLDNLRLVLGRMEALGDSLAGEPAFDAALCCFALYYAEAPAETLGAIRARLAAGGRCFVCGPAPDNNQAFVELVEGVVPRGDQVHRIESSFSFMDVSGPRLFRQVFDRVDLSSFDNPVTFPSPEDVVTYWRSYHLYSERHEAAFRRAVDEHFGRHGGFTTVKRVRGALLR